MNKLKNYDEMDAVYGLAENLNEMQWNFYEFCYYMTFMKALKTYRNEFSDANDKEIENPFFFEHIDDANVRHASKTMLMVSDLRIFFTQYREEPELDEDFYSRHKKFRPAHFHKKRKSYSRLLYYYEQQLEGTIRMIYFYAVVITSGGFNLPLKMRLLPDFEQKGWDYYLDMSNGDVAQIVLSIHKLNAHLRFFREGLNGGTC
jgi:hypothetical protein